MRRKTIGETIGEDLKGPHAAVIPISKPDKEQAPGEPKPQKTRVTFLLANEVMDRVRNCVYWTPGLTLSALMEQAIAEAVEKREKIGNVGLQGKLRKPKRGDQTTIGGEKSRLGARHPPRVPGSRRRLLLPRIIHASLFHFAERFEIGRR